MDQALSPPAYRWFTRMFGVAVLAHVVGNPPVGQLVPTPTTLGVVTTVLGVLAIWLVVRPDPRVLMVAAAAVLTSVWVEAPFLGNHWLVMGFVSLVVLASAWRTEPWVRLAPAARWVLLVFYAFAAFAKLNAGFFDPTVSCGVFYANQTLDSMGLGSIPSGSWIEMAVIVATALIETSVPVLLLIPRTRRVGAVLGIVFHSLISLDFGQHFYDFTAVLLLLFGLFLEEETVGRLEETADREGRGFVLGVATTVLLVMASVGPESTLSFVALRVGAFLVWIPFVVWMIASMLRAGWGRVDVRLRLAGPVTVAIVALVVFNGLTPYTELKTGYGFNMYANLVTVDGSSNHYLIRRTAPVAGGHGTLFEVVESDDPGLDAYVDGGYLLPERNLRHYLAMNPDATALVRSGDGATLELSHADGVELPVLTEKLLLLRAVDTASPPRCQAAWLPAR